MSLLGRVLLHVLESLYMRVLIVIVDQVSDAISVVHVCIYKILFLSVADRVDSLMRMLENMLLLILWLLRKLV